VKALLQEFDFVLLAIGSGAGAKTGAKGENLAGIIDALEFLRFDKLNSEALVKAGEKIGIIGGGNAAIDAARVAKKQGAEVEVVYRRTEDEMPAYKEEVEAAKKDGVKFEFLFCPVEFKGNERVEKIVLSKMRLGNPDESGRRRPVPAGEIVEKKFDKIIIAIGQNADLGWLEKDAVKTIRGHKIEVDENYKTSIEKVYAAGDCVTGPKTIGEATRTGIEAAKAIIKEAEK
jgi:formate dehydrogenase major subunit